MYLLTYMHYYRYLKQKFNYNLINTSFLFYLQNRDLNYNQLVGPSEGLGTITET